MKLADVKFIVIFISGDRGGCEMLSDGKIFDKNAVFV
jgi:hypothetical protein